MPWIRIRFKFDYSWYFKSIAIWSIWPVFYKEASLWFYFNHFFVEGSRLQCLFWCCVIQRWFSSFFFGTCTVYWHPNYSFEIRYHLISRRIPYKLQQRKLTLAQLPQAKYKFDELKESLDRYSLQNQIS